MNPTRDPEVIVAAWLDEGPTDLPDVTRRAIVTALPLTPQARRGLLAPLRLPSINAYTRLAAAAVVAVLAISGALYLIGPRIGVGPPTTAPTMTPAPAASPSQRPVATGPFPTLTLDTTFWIAYAPSRYGYSLSTPPGFGRSPASGDWAGQTSYEMWASTANAPWADKTYSAGLGITMTALAATIPAGTTEAEFIASYLAPPAGPTPTCFALEQNLTPIVIDGRPAKRTTNCGDQTNALSAFVVVGSRMFVFAISDATQPELFAAFLSTVRLPAS